MNASLASDDVYESGNSTLFGCLSDHRGGVGETATVNEWQCAVTR
jgi:hypothetical protein